MLDALIRTCVSRRLFAIVATLAVAAYGVHAYLRTPIEAFPDVTNLQVNVIAQFPGLAPEEVERQLTIPLERSLNGTPGMIQMRSESLFGLSLIWLTFEDDADTFRSRMLVGERIAQAELPDGVLPLLAPDATPLGKILQYRVRSDRHDLFELRSEQEWTITRHLRQVPGVAEVVGRGGLLKEYHVVVDPERLAAAGIGLEEIGDALERSNRNVGGGFLTHGDQELVIRSVGHLVEPEDLLSTVLRGEGDRYVTVGDVARVVQGHTPRSGTTGMDLDDEIVEGVVFLRRGENPSEVLAGLHERIDNLNRAVLPEGMRVEPYYDRGTLVGATLETVHTNLWHGAVLIVGIVWLFLRSVRGSLIVATIIPLSLLTAFIGLYALRLPANLISMGAIDFGIIVDGAVILVENIIHKVRQARAKTQAEMRRIIVQAALEVARPTFFAMAIIVAALIPVFTLERVEGRIFKPLAFTYTFALLGALLFALTFVPALCSLLLRPKDAEVREPASIDRLRRGYEALIGRLIGMPLAVGLVAAGLLATGGWTTQRLGTEFLPELDEGDINVFVEMPPSISMEAGQVVLRDVRRRLMGFHEVERVVSQQGRPEDGTDNEGVNMGQTLVRLRPRDEWRRGLTKEGLIDAMRVELAEIPGVRFNFSQPIRDSIEEALSGVRGQVVLKILGEDLEVMRGTLLEALEVLRPIPGVVDLDLYRDRTVPQLGIQMRRADLAREGIAVDDAQAVIETALAGRVVTEMWERGRPVPVRVLLPFDAREDPGRVGDLPVPTASGSSVPLSYVADVSITEGYGTIAREDDERMVALKFNVEGRDLGSVIREAMAAVEEAVVVPAGHYLSWGGEFESQQRAMARLMVIVPISALVVFALLYLALGHVRGAVCILAITPFGLTGGAFALWVSGVELSVSAAIGFIALLGQVALLGLLVTSAADLRRKAGEERLAAVVGGAVDRFRAVLMAALLASMGLVPMATSSGLGSETQKPFAVVIIGGMVTTLLVAIFLLPVIYARVQPEPRSPEAEDEA